MGRNILMHAARGNHVDVFKKVCGLFEDHHHHGLSRPTEAKGGSIIFTSDNTGRNLLHHAAEAGSLEVLKEVVHLARLGIDRDKADSNGLTPMHHLLRAKYGEPEGREELSLKFQRLWLVSRSWMKPRSVMRWKSSRPEDRTPVDGKKRIPVMPVKAKTELIHAARGGLSTFKLVLGKIGGNNVRVDDVLSVEIDEEARREGRLRDPPTEEYRAPSKEELAQWGWGMLLAAATKGGHVEVLDVVVLAIQVCPGKCFRGFCTIFLVRGCECLFVARACREV